MARRCNRAEPLEFALDPVFVAGFANGGEELVNAIMRRLPGFSIDRNEKFCVFAFGLNPAADKYVGAAQCPNHCARFALFRGQARGARDDVLHGGGAVPPINLCKIRPIFPQAIVDGGRIDRRRPECAVVLDRIELSPTPDERLAGAQNHIHGRGAGARRAGR